MTQAKSQKIFLPALRAKMGDWIYYITLMPMKDIAEKVRVAEEIFQSTVLKELIQRQLSKRAKEIARYLIKQKQRFFSSIIVGLYDGSPTWYDLTVSEGKYLSASDLPPTVHQSIGILQLDGSEKLFAMDGQHRVVAIRQALQEQPSLKDEEVAIIFIAHKTDPKGKERTRRLFTTLNRYAKPVSTRDIIALDEDDPIAITTRRLIEEYPLFTEQRICTPKGKAIPVTDKQALTSIVALYEALDLIVNDKIGEASKFFKKFRPDDTILDQCHKKACDFWDTMIKYFRPLKEVKNNPIKKNVAGKYRHQKGGHLLFRPIGLLSLTRTVRVAQAGGMKQHTAIERLSKMPMILNEPPWVGLLWDNAGKKMITSRLLKNSYFLYS